MGEGEGGGERERREVQERQGEGKTAHKRGQIERQMVGEGGQLSPKEREKGGVKGRGNGGCCTKDS